MRLQPRPWIPEAAQTRIAQIADAHVADSPAAAAAAIAALAGSTRDFYATGAINLNPASNIMNPQAQAMLSHDLAPRPSLGYPGAKVETGLQDIEQIEVITAELAGQVFDAGFAEVRVMSGAAANLTTFMAACRPGDTVIAAPDTTSGYLTPSAAGAAGLYGVQTVPAPIDPARAMIDIDALAETAIAVRPTLITLGGSLGLFESPVAQIREIADDVGAQLLFDASDVAGMIAGRQWANPLDEGAHLMTMSTYKSLGGPVHGLVLSNDPEIAERVEQIAFPGLTANFDVAEVAALGITLTDWLAAGEDYAALMRTTAGALAEALAARDIEPFDGPEGFTGSHQFAVPAEPFGGGAAAAAALEEARLLTYARPLPGAAEAEDADAADTSAALLLGTQEAVRIGMSEADMEPLAELIARALDPQADSAARTKIGTEVAELRSTFSGVHFTAA